MPFLRLSYYLRFNCTTFISGNAQIMWLLITHLPQHVYSYIFHTMQPARPQLVTVVILLPVSPIVRSRKMSWERVVSIMTRLDDRAFDFRKKQQNFLFFKMSRPALGPMMPPVQWGPRGEGYLSLGVKRLGREADYPHLSGSDSKNK
jgi:hypothetical protein